MSGFFVAMLGAGIAALFAGFGSSLGVSYPGRAAAGVLSEDPNKFGRLFLLVALPGTQGFYGFIIALFIILKIGLIGNPIFDMDFTKGIQYFIASLPVGFIGLISGIFQGKVCAAGVEMSAKRPEATMKAVIYAAMVETYAILGLLTSLFLILRL